MDYWYLLQLLLRLYSSKFRKNSFLDCWGIIPIIIGVKGYFSKEDEVEEIEEKLKIIKPDAILWNVLVITFSACGADNMALYIPYFTMLNFQVLPIILVLFIIILTAVSVAAYKLVNVPIVKAFFDKQGDLVQLIVYASLGLYVLVEAGTLQHLLLLIY
ncbi:MAG: cadmium resistance transporter [Leuconostoc suionicum]|uniref:cadmium resistance transporter n=1 Tax=Leuconostoc suionicum TaxID=1511761 RepID=UPI0039EB9C10